MTNKNTLLLSLLIATGPVSADLITSTTGVMVTSRDCIPGKTVCDSFGRSTAQEVGGLPGARQAQASLGDPAFGKAVGSTIVRDAPGSAEMSASVKPLPGKRNGANGVFMQRYTNTSEQEESLTFMATLTYEQTIPAENADFPDKHDEEAGTFDLSSLASAEIYIFAMDIEAIEAGTTASDNMDALMGETELPEGVEPVELHSSKAKEHNNVNGTGTTELSGTVTIAPGNSIWMFAILQSLGANGAEISGTLTTKTSISVQDE